MCTADHGKSPVGSSWLNPGQHISLAMHPYISPHGLYSHGHYCHACSSKAHIQKAEHQVLCCWQSLLICLFSILKLADLFSTWLLHGQGATWAQDEATGTLQALSPSMQKLEFLQAYI